MARISDHMACSGMDIRTAIVDTIRKELQRQYDEDDGVSWYTESLDADSSFKYCAVDGNPDLAKIADRISEALRGSAIVPAS